MLRLSLLFAASATADSQRQLFAAPEFKLVDLLEEDRHSLGGEFFDPEQIPVVFMHGMGGSGDFPGMKGMCSEVQNAYHTYTKCLDVADALSSITTRMDTQLDEFVKAVQSDPKLAKGFHLMGNSQGGLLARAYIERYNSPKVYRFVSLDGVQNGITTCPTAYAWICPLWIHVLNPYQSPLVFSDYWKDHTQRDTYLKESKFLADINNERPTKNAQYKANLASLDLYVLIEATKDTMIYPHQSESHGYYRWTAEDPKGTLQLMRDTQAFSEDWIGLKTLDAAGKIKQMSYPGQHMALPSTMWRAQVMPFFDTKFPPAGESAEEGEERGEQGKRSFKVDVFV